MEIDKWLADYPPSFTLMIIKRFAFLCIAQSTIFFAWALGLNATATDRPNILYIALEDITPMMGCYGDTYAKTPVFA